LSFAQAEVPVLATGTSAERKACGGRRGLGGSGGARNLRLGMPNIQNFNAKMQYNAR